MSLARTLGVAISGVDAHVVEVEAHLSSGLPGMSIVGLGDAAVSESRDRVRAAILTSGARWPQQRITVGLSPASLHKRGSGLDLGIATAILAADGQIPAEGLDDLLLFAELGLDGRVRPVRGAVVAAVAAARAGRGRIAVAIGNVVEADVVPGVEALGVRSLVHWAAVLRGEDAPVQAFEALREAPERARIAGSAERDISDVIGQAEAVAALTVAAVGGHHVAMVGPPGVGKTLLAERLPSLLPDLADEDALTATAIRSVVADVGGLVRRPPFQAPHHSATVAALVGGGRGGQPVPGAATLAHAGVLFLDEAAEFGSACLEALRQPLESSEVCIARAGFTARMPARFQLVMAANPCPCGLADASGLRCKCRSADRRRYLARLSGPLMDRVDLRLQLGGTGSAAWSDETASGGSAAIRQRVVQARERSARRAQRVGVAQTLNGSIPAAHLRTTFAPSAEATAILSRALVEGRLSRRGGDRVLRVAWSLADLAGVDRPGVPEVGQALTLRDWTGGFGDG